MGWCAVRAFLVMLSLLIAAVGCRSDPLYNVPNQSIAASPGNPKTLEDLKAVMVEAGRARGWIVREIAPGHLEAELRLRSHVAVVDIKFSTTSYSITYKDSRNLRYDGTNIHPNYNSWIQNLQTEIEKRL